MNEYRIVSFSGGKDSTAMLLRLMELNEPINEVIWCDTYKEFPEMYSHIAKVRKAVENAGIKFTELRAEHSFDYYMFEKYIDRKNVNVVEKYNDPLGYSWAGPHMRWCTRVLKLEVVSKYIKEIEKKYNVIQYIGIAADEQYRIERKISVGQRHPLVEWNWTEQMCLDYCYSKGYDWNGLYTHFTRASCWCCPLQSLDNLRNLYRFYPKLWDELKDMDKKTWRNFRADFTVEQLEKRFVLENDRIEKGLTINPHSADFRTALKYALGG